MFFLISLANGSFSSFVSSIIFICSFSILLLKSSCALDCWVTISLLKSSCLGETFFIFVGISYNSLSVFSVVVLWSSFKLHVSFENSWFFPCCSLCLLLSEIWFFSRVLFYWWFLFWVSFPFRMLLVSCPFLMLSCWLLLGWSGSFFYVVWISCVAPLMSKVMS